MMLIELAYLSRASRLYSSSELMTLLHQSREFNSANDISGMLLYKDRSFFQVIEGEKTLLHTLFKLIKADPRHYDVRLIFEREIAERNFKKWSMGFFDTEHEIIDVNLHSVAPRRFVFPEELRQQKLINDVAEGTAKNLIHAFTELA